MNGVEDLVEHSPEGRFVEAEQMAEDVGLPGEEGPVWGEEPCEEPEPLEVEEVEEAVELGELFGEVVQDLLVGAVVEAVVEAVEEL